VYLKIELTIQGKLLCYLSCFLQRASKFTLLHLLKDTDTNIQEYVFHTHFNAVFDILPILRHLSRVLLNV